MYGGDVVSTDWGNLSALKEILGHSTMEMVQRHLPLAQMGIEKAHWQATVCREMLPRQLFVCLYGRVAILLNDV